MISVPPGTYPILQAQFINLYPILLIPLLFYLSSTLGLLKVANIHRTRIGILAWGLFTFTTSFLLLYLLRVLHFPPYSVPIDEFLTAFLLSLLFGLSLSVKLTTFGVDKKYILAFILGLFISATLLVYQLTVLIIGIDLIVRLLVASTIGLYLFLAYSRNYEKLFKYLKISANSSLSFLLFYVGTIYVDLYFGMAIGLIVFTWILSYQEVIVWHLKTIQEI